MRFGLGKKDEIRKLPNYLNIHVGTINVLLAEHGLKKMDCATSKTDSENLQIRQRLDGNRNLLQSIKDNVTAQGQVIRNMHTMLATLFEMIGGELKSWLSLSETVALVW